MIPNLRSPEVATNRSNGNKMKPRADESLAQLEDVRPISHDGIEMLTYFVSCCHIQPETAAAVVATESERR